MLKFLFIKNTFCENVWGFLLVEQKFLWSHCELSSAQRSSCTLLHLHQHSNEKGTHLSPAEQKNEKWIKKPSCSSLKRLLATYCGVQFWERIRPVWCWHVSHWVDCFLDPRQNWKCTHNSHPSTQADRQNAQRGGEKILSLLKWVWERLGVGVERLFFFPWKPSNLTDTSSSSGVFLHQSRFKCAWHREKQESKKWWRMRFLCHSERIRYNETERLREKFWFPESSTDISDG